ncbi:hypothetical protein ACIHFD_34335 [Nonomuraea sp. NPDC051941]|uniref:hypothetical protein n=1 Tax=Nonomuraea sp. NPDC051941 TaxID=3364373 RepID=UPI0037CA9D58
MGVDDSRTARSALAWAADTIVVGCDASLCADLALEYAPAQAVVRRARLRVLHGRRSPLTAPNPAGLRAVAR